MFATAHRSHTSLFRPQLDSVQVVSTTHWSLKAASLKMAPTVGTAGRMCIARAGAGQGASIARVQLQGHPTVSSPQ